MDATDVPAVTPETTIRAWAFALRDLCDQGALTVSATIEGDQQPVTFTYTRGTGCKVTSPDAPTLTIPDEALDAVGYVADEAAPSSSKERQIVEGLTIEREEGR